MTIFPAIDLKEGKAVRLIKGEMNSAKIYSNEPFLLAKQFEEMGAKWLHVVDLDGAFSGKPENLEQIKRIRKNCQLRIQIGGGIRDEKTIKHYIDGGVDRVILGSISVRDPQFVKEMAKKYRVVVGIDAIDEMVATDGWAEKSRVKATDLAESYKESSIEGIICTDISKDGTLSGVNVDFTLKMKESSQKEIIASGGVKDEEDLNKIFKSGKIDGVIVGKAFYEGKLDLKEALNKFQ